MKLIGIRCYITYLIRCIAKSIELSEVLTHRALETLQTISKLLILLIDAINLLQDADSEYSQLLSNLLILQLGFINCGFEEQLMLNKLLFILEFK